MGFVKWYGNRLPEPGQSTHVSSSINLVKIHGGEKQRCHLTTPWCFSCELGMNLLNITVAPKLKKVESVMFVYRTVPYCAKLRGEAYILLIQEKH